MPFRLTLGWILAATHNEARAGSKACKNQHQTTTCQYNPVGYMMGGCCDSCLSCYKRPDVKGSQGWKMQAPCLHDALTGSSCWWTGQVWGCWDSCHVDLHDVPVWYVAAWGRLRTMSGTPTWTSVYRRPPSMRLGRAIPKPSILSDDGCCLKWDCGFQTSLAFILLYTRKLNMIYHLTIQFYPRL